MKKKMMITWIACMGIATLCSAQKVALKTNVLYDATTTFNLGAEFWALSKHWNIEAEIGLGYVFSKYDQYECEKCGEKVEDNKAHHYVGPTKAALNLVYVF